VTPDMLDHEHYQMCPASRPRHGRLAATARLSAAVGDEHS
jgi:hypothetical protein